VRRVTTVVGAGSPVIVVEIDRHEPAPLVLEGEEPPQPPAPQVPALPPLALGALTLVLGMAGHRGLRRA
jgi:hypothetical protein